MFIFPAALYHYNKQTIVSTKPEQEHKYGILSNQEWAHWYEERQALSHWP